MKKLVILWTKKQTNKQKKCVIFIFNSVVKSLNSRGRMLHYWLHCSYFISFPSVHISLFMLHLISFSPHIIDHVSFHFRQLIVHLIHFIYHSRPYSHLPYLVVLMLPGHSTLLSVSLFNQSRLWKLTTYDCL